jgi:hypothetical protein
MKWVTRERPKIGDHEMLEHDMVMYDALYACAAADRRDAQLATEDVMINRATC